MRNILKKLGLAAMTISLCCFVVSCDEEETTSFDYQYDGITSVPAVEMDIETARQIQRTGTIEQVDLAKAELEPVAAPVEENSDDMGMDMGTDDPNAS